MLDLLVMLFGEYKCTFFSQLVEVEFGQSELLLLWRFVIINVFFGLSFPGHDRTEQQQTNTNVQQLCLLFKS